MARPRTGKALAAAERMRRYRARKRASGLRPLVTWTAREVAWSDHRLVDARSLALHVVAARRIARDPLLLDRARVTVARWCERYEGRVPPSLAEWKALLERPWEEVLARATALSEDGARLRQSSPLATLLDEHERRRVYDAFRA